MERASQSHVRGPASGPATTGSTASPDPCVPATGPRCWASAAARARSGDSLGRRLAAPAKSRAIKPHAVQHHGELTGERHLGLLHALVSGDAHRPGLEARPARRAGEHDVGRLVQRHTDRSIADFADPARTIDLAGLVFARREAEVGADRFGVLETFGLV